MKKFLSLILALAMCCTMVACSSDTASSDSSTDAENTANDIVGDVVESLGDDVDYSDMLVCYCPPTLADTFLATTAELVGQYCEEYGMQFYATSGEFDIATQIAQTENFIAMGADVIICQPVDEDAFSGVIADCEAQGIRVLYLPSIPTAYDVDASYMSLDDVQGWLTVQMAMAWADENMPNAGDGEIKVALLTQSQNATQVLRCDTMRDGINADPRFTLVFEKEAEDTVAGQTAIEEALATNPDLNLVLCFGDAMAIGANSAFMADSTLDKSTIAVFGATYTDDGGYLVDLSATNESVLRGLVTFGEGDSYYSGMADACKSLIDGDITPNSNTEIYCAHDVYNTIGYSYDFDSASYDADFFSFN